MSSPQNDFGREISDAIVSFTPGALGREPVYRDALVASFRQEGNYRAARIVAGIAVDSHGALEERAVDGLLIRAHCEIQRVSEEFLHGERVAQLLLPVIESLRAAGASRPIRVVDIGCGTGYVLRWLASRGAVGADVELIGADFNPALVAAATALAEEESLACRFLVADAFVLDEPAAIFLSTGVLHHFRGASLASFFAQHAGPETRAFLHFDFQPSVIAGVGAWVFHVLRMREPLSRHDGVLSAQRVHSAETLMTAAEAAGPDFCTAIFGARLWRLPIPRVFHTLAGVRPELREPLLERLGPRMASRLGEWRLP